jgi:putative phosphoribosyl transferase
MQGDMLWRWRVERPSLIRFGAGQALFRFCALLRSINSLGVFGCIVFTVEHARGRAMGGVLEVTVTERKLPGLLTAPSDAHGLIIFAHGSGSSRLSPRNAYAARTLQARGFATLLFDLLTEGESRDRRNVFDIPLLGARVVQTIDWAAVDARTSSLRIGLFGASTGAAAALVAAAARPHAVCAVVSRGGRPDLAGRALAQVRAPTLLIAGGEDDGVLELNRAAKHRMACPSDLVIVPGAGHLFEEPGALDQALAAAGNWFEQHVRGKR